VEKDGSLFINFTGPPATFPIIPYIRVLEGKVPPEALKDKIVLVGATTEAADSFFTPFYSRLLPETNRTMSGVEIHANTVNMYLEGEALERAGWAWTVLLFLIIGIIGSSLADQRRHWLTVSVLAAALAAYLAAGYLLFATSNVWLAVAGPVVGAPLVWGALAFYGFIVERKEKHFVRSTLELYVNPAVVEEVISLGIDLAPGGKRRTLTILFSDIRGFTGLSERLSPEVMVDILNQHFTASSEIILNSGGTLDKFIGDAIMAFWGAPAPHEDHALVAVKVAIEMQAAAKELDKLLQERFGERFMIGVGINTGDAVVGHIGSPRRMGYTAVGDPTNLASRVESLTKEYQAEILITQTTYDLVKEHIEAESLGQVPVKGRKETTAIYRVIGLKENQAFS
jgi:adenylate cyclase